MSVLGQMLNNSYTKEEKVVSIEEFSNAVMEYEELVTETMLDSNALISAEQFVNVASNYIETVPSNVSVESLNVNTNVLCSTLGISTEDVFGDNLSVESIGSFITKVYESIKLLFKKIINSIKKIVVKVMVILNGIGEKAKKLKKALKVGDKIAANSISEEEAKNFNKFYSAIAAIKNTSTFSGTLPVELMNFYKTKVPENLKKGISVIDKMREFITENKAEEGDMFNKLLMRLYREPLPKNIDYEYEDEAHTSVFAVSAIGTKVKMIEVHTNEYGIHLKVISASVEDELDGDIKVMEKSKLIKLLDLIESNAKGLKNYSNNRLSEINKLQKELDKLAEAKSTGSSVKKIVLKLKASVGTNSRALVAGAYLDSIVGYDKSIRKAYSFAKVNANYYNINEL